MVYYGIPGKAALEDSVMHFIVFLLIFRYVIYQEFIDASFNIENNLHAIITCACINTCNYRSVTL